MKWVCRVGVVLGSISLLIGAGFALAGVWWGMWWVIGLVILALMAAVSTRARQLAFTCWVLAFGVAALAWPGLFIQWGEFELRGMIVPLIQVIMLGMGMTLTSADFVRVIHMPRAVLIGIALQFTVMPIVGYTAGRAFGLEGEVAVGLILVGACAGGVASNVITYIAGGNVALSVTMTACSTLAAPIMTPLAMKLLAGQIVPVEFVALMISIIKMIVVPVIIGLILNRYLPRLVQLVLRLLPGVSMFGICMIIAITIALSRQDLLVVGLALLAASVCHNAIGFSLGYVGARTAGLSTRDSRTVAIEVGMQNGGMATGLAFSVLQSPQAAMASAVFGPWSAVAGSILASFWSGRPPVESQTPQSESITQITTKPIASTDASEPAHSEI